MPLQTGVINLTHAYVKINLPSISYRWRSISTRCEYQISIITFYRILKMVNI